MSPLPPKIFQAFVFGTEYQRRGFLVPAGIVGGICLAGSRHQLHVVQNQPVVSFLRSTGEGGYAKNRAQGSPDGVVNTIPVAQKEELLRNLTKNHTVLDASYTQAPAKKATLQAGACYLSGYHWLYHQAVEGFQIMTGLEPDTGAMRRLLGL
jgi:shikimate 5-dehydrogenase